MDFKKSCCKQYNFRKCFQRLGLKTGVEMTFSGYEIGLGFGQPGGRSPTKEYPLLGQGKLSLKGKQKSLPSYVFKDGQKLICVFIAVSKAKRCYHCLEDDGSGDDIALCNSNQISLPCFYRQFPTVGEGQCFTAAGRFKYLDGSEVIHTGIARGCIDCKGKRT